MKIKELQNGMEETMLLMVQSTEERRTVKQETYVVAKMTDGTEQISVKFWNYAKAVFDGMFPAGTVMEVPLSCKVYRDMMTYIAGNGHGIAAPGTYEQKDFIQLPPLKPEELLKRCLDLMNALEGSFYAEHQKLIRTVFSRFQDQLLHASGAKSIHHNLKGGLLYHLYRMAAFAKELPFCSPKVTMELYEKWVHQAAEKSEAACTDYSAVYIAEHCKGIIDQTALQQFWEELQQTAVMQQTAAIQQTAAMQQVKQTSVVLQPDLEDASGMSHTDQEVCSEKKPNPYYLLLTEKYHTILAEYAARQEGWDFRRISLTLRLIDAAVKIYPILDATLMKAGLLILASPGNQWNPTEQILSPVCLFGERMMKAAPLSAWKEPAQQVLRSLVLSVPGFSGNPVHEINLPEAFVLGELWAMAQYSFVDIPFTIAACLLHDLGKIMELDTDAIGNAEYTIPGQLFGHLQIGMELLADIMRELDTPTPLADMFLHVIASHHGKTDWGALIEPVFPEAAIVHHLDMIDSRMYVYEKLGKELESGTMSEKQFALGNERMYRV